MAFAHGTFANVLKHLKLFSLLWIMHCVAD